MKRWTLLLFLPLATHAQSFTPPEISRWEAQAKRVTIYEDDYGIPHIYGKKDADAVFGLMYTECSQNFNRVERNYLEIMGRLSEVEGSRTLYNDLQMRMIYDSAAAKKDYVGSPPWLKALLNAFADGVNYYLYKHPETAPLVLKRFEPWFPLMYTDGSIAPTQTGGLTVQDLKNFYEGGEKDVSYAEPKLSINHFTPDGSNGFAVAPSRTASGAAMLYINPHVTFYFRTEVHLVSDEGLNAYGAVTWGQFFIYQGFNEHCGWMHTSSYADVADVYELKNLIKGAVHSYPYKDARKKTPDGDVRIEYRPFIKKQVAITIKGDDLPWLFTTYYSHHGPVMGKRAGAWLALKEHNRSLQSLEQSWLRTKATGFESFKKVMAMRANNSNNTVFADSRGTIAYWHGNAIPKRNPAYNWALPVDGSTSATEWNGLHTVDETVHLYNPASGFIQNCNSTPFTASGESSPRKEAYPTYMAPEGENGRAVNAVRLLSKAHHLTLDSLIAIGYNRYLTAFAVLLPPLLTAYENLPATDSLRVPLAIAVTQLKAWNKEASASSVATTIAIEWATKLAALLPPAATPEEATNAMGNYNRMAALPAAVQLSTLSETLRFLQNLYGTSNVAWGEVNRYQRSNDNHFNDTAASLPVGLGPATWGSMPSFISRRTDTKKRYGVSGNSFIAAVEFGKTVKAKTILTGGESFNPSSAHYTDQAQGYIDGVFKEVRFYKPDVLNHSQRTYHPGE